MAFGALSLGFAPISLLFLAMSWNLARRNDIESRLLLLACLGLVAVWCLPVVLSCLTRVQINSKELVVSTKLLRGHLIHQRIPCDEIVRAFQGKVHWGRGGSVKGVEIRLANNTTVGLAPSYFMGEKRRTEWIQQISVFALGELDR